MGLQCKHPSVPHRAGAAPQNSPENEGGRDSAVLRCSLKTQPSFERQQLPSDPIDFQARAGILKKRGDS